MSLASPEHPVDLGDVVSGLSPSAFTLVMQAMGQAYGLKIHTDNQQES